MINDESANSQMTFFDHVSEWTDWDVAAFYLGKAIGIFGDEENFHNDAKKVLWSDSPVSEFLYGTLTRLASGGIILERNEPDIQYKFVGSSRLMTLKCK